MPIARKSNKTGTANLSESLLDKTLTNINSAPQRRMFSIGIIFGYFLRLSMKIKKPAQKCRTGFT
jgi:hypothetical protein